jgi:hypothetical protein
MTAEIMPFTRRRVRPPLPQNTDAAAKVPAKLEPLKRIEPSDRATMQADARESLRNGILQYRTQFGSERLAAYLIKLAENERALVKDAPVTQGGQHEISA